MATMNVSLPDTLKDWVEAQAETGRYANASDYVRDLIRKDQDRTRLRDLLLQGAESAHGNPVDEAYFDALRNRIHRRATG